MCCGWCESNRTWSKSYKVNQALLATAGCFILVLPHPGAGLVFAILDPPYPPGHADRPVYAEDLRMMVRLLKI